MAGIDLYIQSFSGILRRESLRFVQQRGRFISALVRPLLWLLVFAAGFQSVLGVAIIEPYQTYITYEHYIAPGLAAMVLLFNSMQNSLSMVYDRELGSMKVLLMSPLPRWFLLFARVIASTLLALPQVYIFFTVAWWLGIQPPSTGFLWLLPALVLCGWMLGGLGLVLASMIKQLENFSGVMNFVIFPMFFMSSALYPLWRILEANTWLYQVCVFNPFTYCVELIRFALYGQLNVQALSIVIISGVCLWALALTRFDPQRGSTKARS